MGLLEIHNFYLGVSHDVFGCVRCEKIIEDFKLWPQLPLLTFAPRAGQTGTYIEGTFCAIFLEKRNYNMSGPLWVLFASQAIWSAGSRLKDTMGVGTAKHLPLQVYLQKSRHLWYSACHVHILILRPGIQATTAVLEGRAVVCVDRLKDYYRLFQGMRTSVPVLWWSKDDCSGCQTPKTCQTCAQISNEVPSIPIYIGSCNGMSYNDGNVSGVAASSTHSQIEF